MITNPRTYSRDGPSGVWKRHPTYHPRLGYQLRLTPHKISGLKRFYYTHDFTTYRTRCDVVIQMGKEMYIVSNSPGDYLPRMSIWCVHAFYRTGLDLFGVTESNDEIAMSALDDLALIGIEPSCDAFENAVKSGQVYPETKSPYFLPKNTQPRTKAEDLAET